MPDQTPQQNQQLHQRVRRWYNSNRVVRFCTNGTAILAFVAAVWQGGAWAANQVDGYFAKSSDLSTLQAGYDNVLKEQKEQRGLLEQQSRQLDFIYLDTMKREKSRLESEIFKLRAKVRSAIEDARLQQLIEDLRDLKVRLREQEDRIRGR